MRVLRPQIDLDVFFHTLAQSRHALLMLDYDGTLAPFCQNPEGAHPYPGVCERIQTIMQLKRTHVVILSGRSLKKLKPLLPIEPLPELWGSHGGERLPLGAKEPVSKQVDPQIDTLLEKAVILTQRLAPALYCERKPFSIALHWRGKDLKIAKPQAERVLEGWKTLTSTLLEICPFDEGMELRVQGINKGEAVSVLLSESPEETPMAYLGDDFTDEDAFAVLKDKALKILVRQTDKPTQADVQLIPPEELLIFLDLWIASQQKS